tara:strand:+ start:2090 stop:2686 length:597 start_codon:yes stop_codon:yes gene_type:complete
MNNLLLEKKEILSEGLQFHIIENISIDNNIYRPGSTKYFNLYREVRDLSEMGLYKLNSVEKYYINETSIGEWGLHKEVLVPLDFPMFEEDETNEEKFNLSEAEYNGRKVKLNKPMRDGSGKKNKYKVYVKDPKTGNIKVVRFGSKGMSVGLKDPKRRKSFAARHKCSTRNDKTKASFWSCRLGRYPHLTGSKKKYTWW